ncbi:alpha/beta hydrolase [Macrococcus equipercicus]|uniref:Alpha/beta hydrolase n=1 Tax=Macrococcus equipercicus TaxID=69967 RepID=A0ABQ6R8A1_9STAP|nr:alpha/beta hydrolase [Macrococcus equipercicus]KAA1039338.1 alpha/beta hydrolase [Macrococcus equipercicus]
MTTFKSGGSVAIAYEVTGHGEPLILIHGINGNLEMFYHNVEELSKHYQVITYDLRGHGRSDRPLNYTMDNHIDDCFRLMQHLKLKRANILGFSLGAYIALGFAIQYPEYVNKLILVGGKGHGEVSSYARLMIKHRHEIKGLTKEQVLDKLHPYIYHNTDIVDDWLLKVKDYATMTSNEEAIASRSMANFDYRDELKFIDKDVLLIVGEHDGLNPPEESEAIEHEVKRSFLLEFQHSGHAPLVEEHARFNDTVIRFLS